MKIILIATLVIDDDCEEQASPVQEPDVNPLDMLLARLLHETKKGRNPEQHGPQTPSGVRHCRNVAIFKQGSETT